MGSKKIYIKIVGSVLLIVIFSVLGTVLFITGWSYTLLFVCLVVILLITLFIIRLMTDTDRKLSTFFGALRNHGSTQYYPQTGDAFLDELYSEMNRITGLFSESRTEIEEKRLYYESLLRVLTHEIRNSITPIASLSDDLFTHTEEYTSMQLKEGLDVIHGQAQSLKSFLDSYHRLTHLPDPACQDIEVADLFVRLNRLLCAEPNTECIRYEVSGSLQLHADPNLIILALINLIRNALYALHEQSDGWVEVKAKQINSHVRLVVADNGPGIPAERLSAVFTPFYSTKPGGSGIGLSISRRIMRMHGGDLTVASSPGVRTAFIMEFV